MKRNTPLFDATNVNDNEDNNVINIKKIYDKKQLENGILKQDINDIKTIVAIFGDVFSILDQS